MVENKKRIEVHTRPGYYERLRLEADRLNIGMGELLLRAVCKELGDDPALALMPRLKPGRKAGKAKAEPAAPKKPARRRPKK